MRVRSCWEKQTNSILTTKYDQPTNSNQQQQKCTNLYKCANFKISNCAIVQVWNCAGLCKPRLLWQRNCVSYLTLLTLRSRVAADLDILPIASGRCLEPCCGCQLVHFSDGWQPGSIYCSALVRIDTSHFFRLLSSHWPRSNTLGFGTKQNCCRL